MNPANNNQKEIAMRTCDSFAWLLEVAIHKYHEAADNVNADRCERALQHIHYAFAYFNHNREEEAVQHLNAANSLVGTIFYGVTE